MTSHRYIRFDYYCFDFTALAAKASLLRAALITPHLFNSENKASVAVQCGLPAIGRFWPNALAEHSLVNDYNNQRLLYHALPAPDDRISRARLMETRHWPAGVPACKCHIARVAASGGMWCRAVPNRTENTSSADGCAHHAAAEALPDQMSFSRRRRRAGLSRIISASPLTHGGRRRQNDATSLNRLRSSTHHRFLSAGRAGRYCQTVRRQVCGRSIRRGLS